MPYAEYAGFGERYFHAGPLDGPPAGYNNYRNNLPYADFANVVVGVTGQSKVLVIGPGFGYILRRMRIDQGVDRAVGMDISQYARDNAIPDVQDQIFAGDARNQADIDNVAQNAQGPPRWDAIHTEFLLEHYTDSEAQQIHQNCLNASGNPDVIHHIWSGTGSEWETDWFNLKRISEWDALLGGSNRTEWMDYDHPEDNTI